MAGLAAAIYQGPCSGHGCGVAPVPGVPGAPSAPPAGGTASHHPGLGGGLLPNCPHPSLSPTIKPVAMPAVNAVAIWPPLMQAPFTPLTATRNVFINKAYPIIDQDLLTTHPTPTQFTTSSIGYKCFTTLNTPAWWCTMGTTAGREAPVGHARKLFATSKTVFINGRRAGRFSDPFGDGSTAFPCLSVVTGSSINVFIGI